MNNNNIIKGNLNIEISELIKRINKIDHKIIIISISNTIKYFEDKIDNLTNMLKKTKKNKIKLKLLKKIKIKLKK